MSNDINIGGRVVSEEANYQMVAKMITKMKRDILIDKQTGGRKAQVIRYRTVIALQDKFALQFSMHNDEFDYDGFGHACREGLFDNDVPNFRESAFRPLNAKRQEAMICNWSVSSSREGERCEDEHSRDVIQSEVFIIGSKSWKRDQELSKATGRKPYAKGDWQK
jgi:hypothetical protein